MYNLLRTVYLLAFESGRNSHASNVKPEESWNHNKYYFEKDLNEHSTKQARIEELEARIEELEEARTRLGFHNVILRGENHTLKEKLNRRT